MFDLKLDYFNHYQFYKVYFKIDYDYSKDFQILNFYLLISKLNLITLFFISYYL